MELQNIFTDFLLVGKIQTDLDKLLKDVLDYKEKNGTTSLLMTNRGGYQSPPIDYDKVKEDYDTFPLLLNELNETMLAFSRDMSYNNEPEGTICLGNSWINVNTKYNYNTTHTHPMSYLSGVVYLKVPKDSGNINFYRPREFNDYGLHHVLTGNCNAYNGYRYTHQPVEGQMIIFPSYLEHDVDMSMSEEDRVTIAFNTINMEFVG
jgi:uncharacterized protein (TIGR02466 family)